MGPKRSITGRRSEPIDESPSDDIPVSQSHYNPRASYVQPHSHGRSSRNPEREWRENGQRQVQLAREALQREGKDLGTRGIYRKKNKQIDSDDHSQAPSSISGRFLRYVAGVKPKEYRRVGSDEDEEERKQKKKEKAKKKEERNSKTLGKYLWYTGT